MSVLTLTNGRLTTTLRRGTATVLALAITSLFALVLLSWQGSASADPYPPGTGCTVSTSTVNAGPGQTVTLVGSGFAPHETVTLSIPSASAALGSVTTNGKGSFSGTFTWPGSVTGKSAVVEASAASTSCSFSLQNGTEGVSTHRSNGGGSTGSVTTTNSTGSGGLSSTGFATLTATTIAVLLLGSGAVFLGLARRKRV